MAVPSVTTSRIIVFSAASACGLSCGPSGAVFVGAGSSTSFGCFHWPRATAAAAPASAAGDTIVVPWPNAAAACSSGGPPVDTLPLNTSMPASHGTPMPRLAAVVASPSAPSFGASDANAVLHDFAKSTCSGTVPSSKSCAFL